MLRETLIKVSGLQARDAESQCIIMALRERCRCLPPLPPHLEHLEHLEVALPEHGAADGAVDGAPREPDGSRARFRSRAELDALAHAGAAADGAGAPRERDWSRARFHSRAGLDALACAVAARSTPSPAIHDESLSYIIPNF